MIPRLLPPPSEGPAPAAPLPWLVVCQEGQRVGALARGQGTRDHNELTFDDLASGICSQHYCYHRLLFLTCVLMGDVSCGSRRTPVASSSSDIIKYTFNAIRVCMWLRSRRWLDLQSPNLMRSRTLGERTNRNKPTPSEQQTGRVPSPAEPRDWFRRQMTILKPSQVIVLVHSQVCEILNELSWANKGILVFCFFF